MLNNHHNNCCFGQQQYFEMRKRGIAALRDKNEEPYPHKFHVSISLAEYVEKYRDLETGQHLTDVQLSVAGRRISSVCML